jgi:hypothetical protein
MFIFTLKKITMSINLDNVYVGDIEAIGFLDKLNSFGDLHVFSCAYKRKKDWGIVSTNKKEDIQKVVGNPDNIIVFHNGISYDKPALEKLGIEFNAFLIDTLPLSYYLYSEKDKHGLESWGEFFGELKPKITDWVGLNYEEYKNRCEVDVAINTRLWLKMLAYLRTLYSSDEEIIAVIKNLNHKANCLYIQDQNPILIDVEKCQENLNFLQKIIEEKNEELKKIMPKVPVAVTRKKPNNLFRKDSTTSVSGQRWFDLLEAQGLPASHEEDVKEVVGHEEPNPGSPAQMKDYLFSKSWKPKIFKDGANGKVPQLRDEDKNLCESITKLIKDYPELEALDGLSVATHRAGYLKSFLGAVDERGYAKAWAHGFTRTLRLKHVAPFVNLPKPNANYGELVRSVMVAPEGYVCIGADLSSIEDKCKQISIYNLDYEYVMSMNQRGWDAHLALGLKSGMFTEDEVQFYKWWKSRDKEEVFGSCPESFLNLTDKEKEEAFEILDKKRAVSKKSNYSLTYGCGVAKLMESADISQKEAKKLHTGYWNLNNSVKRFAKERIVKKVGGHNWLRHNKKSGGLKEVNETNWIWNEFTNMWLFLKNDKDRFSACNQNFGVKVFDVWGWFLIEEGIKPSYQAHDEFLWYCKVEDVEKHKEIIKRSVIRLNRAFNPPIPLEVDYKIGLDYSAVH